MKFGHRGYVNRFVLYCLQLPLGCFALVVFTVKSIFVQLLKGFCLFPRKRNMTYEPTDEEITSGNKYVDKMLDELVRERGHEYEPYQLEDHTIGFFKQVLFQNVSGDVKLAQGSLSGLTSLHRSDSCSFKREGDRLKVEANMGAGVLQMRYVGSANFMNFGYSIVVTTTVPYMEVNFQFTVNAKTGTDGKLEKFRVTDMRGRKTQITGLGSALNFAARIIIAGVDKLFNRHVTHLMEEKIAGHLSQKIEDYQFPVEGDGETPAPEVAETSSPPSQDPQQPLPITPDQV